jgi:nitroimidazol reductase NimA-like FMN-containing flavoprotein (pyridoxamine 5'-phosphate oxidase superfamily)
MALPRELSLSDAQIDEIMRTQWNLRVATLGPASRINLTPMWFGWGGGAVYFYGRGQKVVHLRRNAACTILVDRHERFPELQGIMLQGAARVLESTEAEAQDPHLAEVQAQMGIKYNGGHGQPAVDNPGPFAATARGRNRRWVVLEPQHVVTWDNFKLPKS